MKVLRKIRRKNKKVVVTKKEEVWCSICKKNSIISNDNVIEMICGDCFAKIILREELKENPPKQKPTVKYVRGWALRKKYKAPDGKVFSFGKEVKRKVKLK